MSCAVQIDGLIVNCSAFNPTPSLSAAVVNHFKFKQSIRTFNLSGMGCAASVIGVDLAMEILAVSCSSLELPRYPASKITTVLGDARLHNDHHAMGPPLSNAL